MSQFNSSIENPQSCGDDVAENLLWEPQGPAPRVMNNGARRPVLVISSDELALWLGYDKELMGRLVLFHSFWMNKKQAQGVQYLTTIYRPRTGECTHVYWLKHRAALRLCKMLQSAAVPALQAVFAAYRKRAALPGLEVREIDYSSCIRYAVGNATYHGADRVIEAFGHDLACDAEKHADRLAGGRPMSAQMVGDVLEIRIYDARDFSQHKERALLQLKRLIRSALSIHELGGVAA
ncbi:hypothetical protein ACTPOE_16645 [Castellaniella sp. WN]